MWCILACGDKTPAVEWNEAMRKNNALEIWKDGGVVINGWLHNPSSFSAEMMAHHDYDCLTIDLQHGMIDFQVAVTMLQAISTASPTPLARVPHNDPAIIMKLLDAGAYGIVCPFVNTREECERFVGACRYPPYGFRSNGPHRAVLYSGGGWSDYTDHANETIATIAMIESREGLENVDAILSVEGLDAVLIGTTDLAFSLGCSTTFGDIDPQVRDAIEIIMATAKKYGCKVGTISPDGLGAKRAIQNGFDMVTPGTETSIMQTAVASQIEIVRAGLNRA